MARYKVDVSFYSMELTVTAKNAAEARKKAKPKIRAKAVSHIIKMYLEKEQKNGY